MFTDPEDKEYWLPRLHFANDTVASLRKDRSWLADLVDAWSEQQPTVAALWPPSADAGAAAPPPADARYLDLFDATPPLSGLKAAAAGR